MLAREKIGLRQLSGKKCMKHGLRRSTWLTKGSTSSNVLLNIDTCVQAALGSELERT